MKITKVKPVVKKLLEKYPILRDSDSMLVSAVWFLETDKDKHKKAFDFLSEMFDGEYTKPESIRRCRQKLQREFPHLRGRNIKSVKAEIN